MPVPATVPELLDRVRRSGLIPTDRLEGFLVGLQTTGSTPRKPADVLDRLLHAGMITPFHADRLAQGKYKGFQLGSYLILDQIGSGGMGQVYLAEHAAMRRLVALKVLPTFTSDDVVSRERFFREARAAAALDHPNIVRVFDMCQEGRLLYLVMEYAEGVSLQALVAKHGALGVEAAAHYARQVAFGLTHAHTHGFVHRDIKPANLLVDRAGTVHILDLGLVRSEAEAAAGLTKQLDNKSILGTADYVAPEQAVDSSKVDVRADVYSLGATLYFLLAGRPLFPEGRTAQKLVWQQIKEPTHLSELRPDVPAELAAVVHTMIQKKPADRYQTADEVFEALAPWTQGEVPVPDPAVLPVVAARIAAVKAAAAVGTVRSIGSGMYRAAAKSGVHPALRADDSLSGGSSSNAITPPKRSGLADPSAQTDAVAMDETKRTPRKPPAVVSAPERRPAWQIAALAAGGTSVAWLALYGLFKLLG